MNNFRDNIIGRLLWAEADQNTRFKYTIWFDYTRRLVNDLHEGDLVAAPNFATDPSGIRYSILQLVTVMPMHYALGTDIRDLKGYPGFVMQAAKSASADWTEQETESYEDTTKIICEAIPTNMECDESGDVKQERSMAMVGKVIERRVVLYFYVKKGISSKDITMIRVSSLAPTEGSYDGVLDLTRAFMGETVPYMFEPKERQPTIFTLVTSSSVTGKLAVLLFLIIPFLFIFYPQLRNLKKFVKK